MKKNVNKRTYVNRKLHTFSTYNFVQTCRCSVIWPFSMSCCPNSTKGDVLVAGVTLDTLLCISTTLLLLSRSLLSSGGVKALKSCEDIVLRLRGDVRFA